MPLGPLPPQNPIIPIALKDPSLVADVSTVISGLQRRATTEVFNNSEVSSQIYFVLVAKGVSAGPSWGG